MADVQRLIADDPQLRVVFREWPVFGEGSMFAAKAALASLQRAKYWPLPASALHCYLKGRAEEATVLRACQAGLDVDRLRVDMEKREILDQIYETMDLADTHDADRYPHLHRRARGVLRQAEPRRSEAAGRNCPERHGLTLCAIDASARAAQSVAVKREEKTMTKHFALANPAAGLYRCHGFGRRPETGLCLGRGQPLRRRRPRLRRNAESAELGDAFTVKHFRPRVWGASVR